MMKWPEFKWIEVAVGGVNKRNNLVDIRQFKTPSPVVADCFRTVYRYPDGFRDHVKDAGTVAGYKGPVYADYFPVDIDDQNLEVAQEKARHVLNQLLEVYEVNLDDLWLYFSGAKGFHILIPAEMFDLKPGAELPRVFKAMASRMFQDVKIDPVIYDVVRLFRIPNTKHGKSGLFKVPVTAGEILNGTIDDIKGLAKQPRNLDVVDEHAVNPCLQALYKECQSLKHQVVQVIQAQDQVEAIKPGPPKDAKLCYYALLEGVGEGERDNAALRLAVHFRKQGFASHIVLGLLSAWNQRNSPPLGQLDIEKAVKQAFGNSYDFGCNDAVLKSHCSEKCHLRQRKAVEKRVSAENIYSMAEAKERYLQYLSQLDKRKITLGFTWLDKAMRGVAPGEVCEIMARAGVGKTAFLLNVIRHISLNQHVPILFFSLEQPVSQIFERATQISTGVVGADLEALARQQSPKLVELASLTLMNYKDVYIVDQDFLTYEELRDFVKLAEETKIGQKVRVICVDYLGRMSGEYGTAYEVTSNLAKLLKRLAKELDVALIYLHQTSRAGRTGAEPVTLDMARDSGVVEEAADFVLGLWRPDIEKAQKDDEEEIMVAVLKNRKGPLCKDSLKFRKRYLIIEPWEGVSGGR